MDLKLDDNGILEVLETAAQSDVVIRGPVAAVLGQLFGLLGADLTLTRDGRAILAFNAAPNTVIADLVDDDAIETKTLDQLIDALTAEISDAPDEDDHADLVAFRTRLQYAINEVDALLERMNDAGSEAKSR